MKKIFVKIIEKMIEFDKPIINISLESQTLYKKFFLNFDNSLILSEGDKEIDSKYLLVIEEPLNIDLNNQKLIKCLNKKLLGLMDDKDFQKVRDIDSAINDLVKQLSFKLDVNITYDDIDASKLLQAITLQVENVSMDNYLDYLINYLKLQIDLLNIKFVVAFRMLDFLTDKEQLELEYFLKTSGLVILNIDLLKGKSVPDLIIDNDYCII